MQRLLAALAGLALIIVLVGGLSAFILRETVARKDEVISGHAQDMLLLEDFIAINERAARKSRSFLLTGNPRFLRERQQARKELDRQLAELMGNERTPEGRLLLEQVEALATELGRELDGLLERRRQGMDAAEAGRGASIILSGMLAFLLLRSWQRLMDAAQFQQRVIAIVGHDVRSPLAAILASTSHALTRQDLDSRVEGLLSRVLRSARRIEVLTKLLMHPVLANLVDNALRHGEQGKAVRVRSRGTNPSILEVSIHNEGPPIEPKLLPRIFEPFQHGRPAQEVVRESLGMGLYIVSEVVKAHGGRVDVESTREQGTTFTVRLPRVPVSPASSLPR